MDCYQEERKIAELLKKEGCPLVAENINNIISAGMTSTEILMGIKYYLEKIQQKKLSDTTKEKVLSFIREIEVLLK